MIVMPNPALYLSIRVSRLYIIKLAVRVKWSTMPSIVLALSQRFRISIIILNNEKELTKPIPSIFGPMGSD